MSHGYGLCNGWKNVTATSPGVRCNFSWPPEDDAKHGIVFVPGQIGTGIAVR
jgi:hypothetical protein